MATPVGGIDDTLDNGIIGYWSFDGDYLDSSGNGNDFTKVGNPILIPDKDGEADHAYGSLYNGGYFTQSSPIGSVDIFGFSLWIYVPTAGGTGYKDYGGFYDTSAGLLIERTLSDNLTYIGKVGGNVTPTLSEGWHNIIINHPAVSPDIHVYVDGIIETTGGPAQVGTGFTYFRIGAGVFDATPCSIDEIRLNDRIFTASEIAEIQTMGVNYGEAVLVKDEVQTELNGKFGLVTDTNLFTEITVTDPDASVYSLGSTDITSDTQLIKSYTLDATQSWLLVRDTVANTDTALALAINIYRELKKGNVTGLTSIRDGLVNNKRIDSEGRIYFTILTEKI